MNVSTKKNNILSIFKSIKDLDPFFFELLMDSISDSNKISILKKKPQALLIIYSNIFATKKLNIPLAKEKTLGLQIDKVNTDVNLLYSILSIKTIQEERIVPQLKKNLFYKFYLNRYNKPIASQVRNSIKIIKSWDKI